MPIREQIPVKRDFSLPVQKQPLYTPSYLQEKRNPYLMPLIDSNRNLDSLDNEKDEMTLKQRLNHLRRMFDEETGSGGEGRKESPPQTKPNYVSSPGVPDVTEWGFKIDKNVSDQKERNLRNMQSEDTSVNPSENEEEKQTLKDFLTKKI